MKCHQHHLALFRVGIAIHDKRDMFKKPLQRVEILHRIDKFGQVLQPPFRLRRPIGLPHRGIARFIKHHLGKFGMGQRS